MSEDQVNRQTFFFSYLMEIGTVKNIKIILSLFDVYTCVLIAILRYPSEEAFQYSRFS